eukprot:TRINITY_DN6960_c0_g1_i1.p1 TRINITY_DN6960_c0_g1~~TRINITY_DN6960_c0_g1_i1.p1  ORF type:complete len:112 (+),score=7.75 TRINITY_DN6960_c0_g1_i1:50-385(+)
MALNTAYGNEPLQDLMYSATITLLHCIIYWFSLSYVKAPMKKDLKHNSQLKHCHRIFFMFLGATISFLTSFLLLTLGTPILQSFIAASIISLGTLGCFLYGLAAFIREQQG